MNASFATIYLPISWLAKHRKASAAVFVIAMSAAVFGPQWMFGPRVAVHPVQQREFVQSVVASGRVQAPHRVELGTPLTGTVSRVAVVEGQQVRAGELLVELESAEQRAAFAQADLLQHQAALKLRQIEELQKPLAEQALRQAQANFDSVARQRQRSRDLFEQGFVGQIAVDEAWRAWEVADASLRSARQQLHSMRATGSEYGLAQLALAQARAAVQAAQARLAQTRIKAPTDGLVIRREVEPGTVVQAGRVLLMLAPQGATELVLQVDERNLHLLKPGQRALASPDAYPEMQFEAALTRIMPGVDAHRGSVEVRLLVPQPPPELRQDMTVSVDIEVARRDKALVVPVEMIHQAAGATPWVLKLQGRHVQRQPVKIGLRSTAQVEVLHGLSVGDLIVAPGQGVQAGQRARPTASKA